MAYRRTSSRRTRAPSAGRVRRGTRSYSRAGVSSRRRTSSRSSSAGRTVRIVIEQAAPAVQPVVNEEGRFVVPSNGAPRRAKF